MNMKKTVDMYYAHAHKSNMRLTGIRVWDFRPLALQHALHPRRCYRPVDVNDSDDFVNIRRQ